MSTISGRGDRVVLTVRGLTITCWNCQRPTTVVVGLHPAAATTADQLIRCDREPILESAAQMLRRVSRFDVAAPIKTRTSRTAGGDRISNGCQRCDALQADRFIFSEPLLDALTAGGLDGLDHLVDVAVPATDWQRIRDHGDCTCGI